ncbi:MAG: M24 family metallopeptidase, partial [Oscillospiraceae bacterium]|nr:M24 family metallopeptidase [Oscillospiraceae bacterium]
QAHAEANGYSVVRDYVGHGVGAQMHEEPEVPNFGRPGHGQRLVKGMTIAVEPMINAGGWEIKVLPDGWTVLTADGSLSAHYENSILITDGEAQILTVADDI